MQGIVDELNNHIDFYQLDTPLRRTHFFVQVMQETGSTLQTAEYTNYRITTLDTPTQKTARGRTYPQNHKLYPGMRYIDVHAIDRKENGVFLKADGTPVTDEDKRIIFNVMYGGRKELGNGDFLTTDDGWNFRGRGLKQLTGRSNYTSFNDWHAANQEQWPGDVIDAIDHPEVLLDIKYATRSAVWFWLDNKLPIKADKGSDGKIVDAITKAINFYTDSYAARKDNFKKLWKAEVFE